MLVVRRNRCGRRIGSRLESGPAVSPETSGGVVQVGEDDPFSFRSRVNNTTFGANFESVSIVPWCGDWAATIISKLGERREYPNIIHSCSSLKPSRLLLTIIFSQRRLPFIYRTPKAMPNPYAHIQKHHHTKRVVAEYHSIKMLTPTTQIASKNTLLPTTSFRPNAALTGRPQHGRLYVTLFNLAATSNTLPFPTL